MGLACLGIVRANERLITIVTLSRWVVNNSRKELGQPGLPCWDSACLAAALGNRNRTE